MTRSSWRSSRSCEANAWRYLLNGDQYHKLIHARKTWQQPNFEALLYSLSNSKVHEVQEVALTKKKKTSFHRNVELAHSRASEHRGMQTTGAQCNLARGKRSKKERVMQVPFWTVPEGAAEGKEGRGTGVMQGGRGLTLMARSRPSLTSSRALSTCKAAWPRIEAQVTSEKPTWHRRHVSIDIIVLEEGGWRERTMHAPVWTVPEGAAEGKEGREEGDARTCLDSTRGRGRGGGKGRGWCTHLFGQYPRARPRGRREGKRVMHEPVWTVPEGAAEGKEGREEGDARTCLDSTRGRGRGEGGKGRGWCTNLFGQQWRSVAGLGEGPGKGWCTNLLGKYRGCGRGEGGRVDCRYLFGQYRRLRPGGKGAGETWSWCTRLFGQYQRVWPRRRGPRGKVVGGWSWCTHLFGQYQRVWPRGRGGGGEGGKVVGGWSCCTHLFGQRFDLLRPVTVPRGQNSGGQLAPARQRTSRMNLAPLANYLGFY